MRSLGILVASFGLVNGATLEKLSLDEMIQNSTEIVQAKVTARSGVMRGPLVYTRYRVSVSDVYKGNVSNQMDVHVPGGTYGSVTQTFSGTPTMGEGDEYVLFLWTSRSGLTTVICLSQGLFSVRKDSKGEAMLMRQASTEAMVDPSGKLVEDTPVSLRLRDVVDRIRRSLTGGND